MLRKEILKLALENRLKVIQILILNLLIPPLEISILGLIYLILNSTDNSGITASISQYIPIAFTSITTSAYVILLSLCTFTIIIIWAFLRMYRARINAVTRYNIYAKQANRIVTLYLGLTGNAHNKEKPEEMANLILQLSGVSSAHFMAWLGLLSSLISIIVLFTTALVASPIITSAAIILGIVSILINVRNFNRMKSIGEVKVGTHEEMLYEVNQNIRGFEIIKFDNLKDVVLRKMNTIIQKDWSWRVDKRTTGERVTMLSDSFGLISLLIIVTIASTLVPLSIETLLILILLFSRLRAYTAEYQVHWVNIKEHRSGTLQCLETMQRLDSNNVGYQTRINGIEGIHLDNVSFSFDQNLILNNLSTSISKGDRILLTGKSGDGKSTLLKVIAGYFIPDEGIITINNYSPNKATTINTKVTDHIFYASNEMYIPNTTLKNFIDPECQMEPGRIKKILKEACLNEILEQHNVLNEPIGDNAGNFSLGQRQRLLLARVYIQSPSVVILDEATSNLDAATEQQVLSNFMRHLNPSTILIVSAHHSPPIIKFNKEYKLSETGMVESEIVSGS